jgi:hypothetical protein
MKEESRMKRLVFVSMGLGILAGISVPLAAQRQRVSPHETVAASIGGKKITIEYGRPSVKGRKIFGELVPLGQVWRTGADEATILTTEGDLMLGSLHVPAGSYSLFTLPEAGKWTLIINKTAKQWGAFNYDAKQDLGRAEMKLDKASSPVEQLTISIAPKGGNQGTLKIAWDTAEATINVMMH